MNVFCKVALQSLKNSRARTLVTVAGVALSAALIVAVATFAVSLQTYMINGAAQKYGDWHAEFPGVDSDFIARQAADGRVKAVAAWQDVGYAALEGGQNPNKPYLFVAGFTESAFDTLPLTLYSGRMPENGDEIVVPAHVAANGGVRYAVGDRLALRLGERRADGEALNQLDPYREGERLSETSIRVYTVVGLCQRLSVERRSAPGYTLITRADQDAPKGGLTAFVTLKRPSEIRAYLKSASPAGGGDTNGELLRFMGLSDDTLFNAVLYGAGGVLIALVMIGSVFLIYNAFSISLGERVRQFGILMSVGATKRQLLGSVLFEGLCLGAMGIPLGILIGLPGIRLALAVASKRFTDILYANVPLRAVFSLPALVAAAAVSLATLLISAWIPARRAASMPVMACIRQNDALPVDAHAVRVPPAVERLWGVDGALALKSFRRNRGRSRSVILSLTFSVVLTVSATAFGGCLRQLSERVRVYTNYDVALSAPEMDDAQLPDLYAALETAEGVTGGNYQRVSDYAVEADGALLTDAYWSAAGRESGATEALVAEVQFLNDAAYRDLLRESSLSEADYGAAVNRWPAVGKALDGADEFREVEEFPDLFRASEARLTLLPMGDGDAGAGVLIDLAFANLVPPDTPPVTEALNQVAFLTILAPWSERDAFPDTAVRARGLTFTSDSPARTTARLREILDGLSLTGGYTLLNVHEMLDQSRNILFIARLFSAIFITMIALIAVANVFNTVATSLRLRRRELAMLRSVGQSARGFNRMLRLECALYGLDTLLWGLPVSALASRLIHRGMDADGLKYAFPWAGMAVSAAGVLAVVSLATLYAAGRLKRENIIDALRDDTL